MREACGIVGVYNHPEAANLVYLALYALQHRGQESAGIVSCDDNFFFIQRGMGRVATVFNEEMIKQLPGNIAIGHVRYSTSGESDIIGSQPLLIKYGQGTLAVAHNGNLINAEQIRDRLITNGSIFQTDTDSEVIVHLIAKSKAKTFIDRLVDSLFKIKGGYSLVFMTDDMMIGMRDPYGLRPLALGKIGDAYILVSETCALNLIEAELIREIEPGEMVIINSSGLTFQKPLPAKKTSFCVFEYIYFARPDSIVHGQNVHAARKRFGNQLAKESFIDADLVIPIPDSGTSAAIGFAEESSIHFDLGMIRNRYVGRTFIEPQQSIRHFGVKLKLNPNRELIEGKRVIAIDDSIVRATTSRKIVSMIREAGAKEVHIRVSCPPVCFPCYYGIDTPTRAELIASTHTIDEIRRYIGADSLAYLSLKGMKNALGPMCNKICTACYTGKYPIPFTNHKDS
ncbi:MAG: amidophosphoribosyltransferase [bacterium]